jgi:superoxide dismutase
MLRCSATLRRSVTPSGGAALAAANAAVPVPPLPPPFPTPFVPKARAGRDWRPLGAVHATDFATASSAAAAAPVAAWATAAPPSLAQVQSGFFGARASAARAAATLEGTAAWRETEAAAEHYDALVKPARGYFHVPEPAFSLHDGVAPLMSATQAKLLRDVHHAGLVERLNALTLGTPLEGHPLDAIILATAFDAANAAVHTCACEHWNHSVAWRCIVPFGAAPSARMRDVLATTTLKQQSPLAPLDVSVDWPDARAASLASVAGFDRVKRMLSHACRDAAASGGGWVFLVSAQAGLSIEVVRFRPGTSPVTAQLTPLAVINMQWHARYADYKDDDVQGYIDNAIRAINWNVAEANWARSAKAHDDG